MGIRVRFEQQLNELRDQVVRMGRMVEEELVVALEALAALDLARASQVHALDVAVNAQRYDIEDQCFALIVTQQPAARDLRFIVTAMNMIVDLERMGDQAKGIAKVVPHMVQSPDLPQPAELAQMGQLARGMLNEALTAYASDNVELARLVAAQDDAIDHLYATIFGAVMRHMAEVETSDRVEATYEALRAARELERFGDLATNLAERVIYMVTGKIDELNVDRDDSAG
jgi:phosphate transport system protein